MATAICVKNGLPPNPDGVQGGLEARKDEVFLKTKHWKAEVLLVATAATPPVSFVADASFLAPSLAEISSLWRGMYLGTAQN